MRDAMVDDANGRVAIMCVGNVLLRDEGLGPLVAQRLLETYRFPDCVDVLDSGTMGMSLLPDIETHGFLVVVDAVEGTGQPPGTVFTFTPDEMADNTIMHSLHDMRLKDVLLAAQLLGYAPRAICVGAQVKDMAPEEFEIGLTPELEAAVPLVMETVIALLVRHGVAGIERRDGKPLRQM